MKKKKYVYIYIYITVFSSLRCLENSVKKKRSLDSKKKKKIVIGNQWRLLITSEQWHW